YEDFEKAIAELLDRMRPAKKIEPEHRRRFAEILSDSADWSEAKKYGVSKLSGGELTKAKELLNALASFGLFLVRRGELERWWPEGPAAGDKTGWFVEAMKRVYVDENSFVEAGVFVARVAAFFGRKSTLDISRWMGV